MGYNTDHNFYSIADTGNVTIEGKCFTPAPGDQIDDTLKFSNAHNCVVKNCTVVGIKEDCIDINRGCYDIRIETCWLEPHGLYAMTIKGGSRMIYLENVVLTTHGKSGVDIDLGNFTEVSDEKTYGIVLNNVTAVDGKPVTVRVLNAAEIQVQGGNVVVTTPWYVKLGLFKAYCFLRKHGILRS